MKFLVIGLGSMGQRRIRCLQHLKYNKIFGYDINPVKAKQVKKKYNIELIKDLKEISKIKLDLIIISTDPRFHMKYAFLSLKKRVPCFIEASVTNIKKIKKLVNLSKKEKYLVFPSCTMIFNNSIKIIKNIINQNKIGKVYFVKYHVGQYLPDWHPWENIKDFYVGNKETNGCKELIPFELTWLVDIFGIPRLNFSYKKKLSKLKLDFEDIHCLSMKFRNDIYIDMTIEVLSRPQATRELKIVGSEGLITLSFDQGLLKFKNVKMKKFKIFPFNSGKIVKGYINSEQPYINEIKSVLKAIKLKKQNIFPNSIAKDYQILKLTNNFINNNKF